MALLVHLLACLLLMAIIIYMIKYRHNHNWFELLLPVVPFFCIGMGLLFFVLKIPETNIAIAQQSSMIPEKYVRSLFDIAMLSYGLNLLGTFLAFVYCFVAVIVAIIKKRYWKILGLFLIIFLYLAAIVVSGFHQYTRI